MYWFIKQWIFFWDMHGVFLPVVVILLMRGDVQSSGYWRTLCTFTMTTVSIYHVKNVKLRTFIDVWLAWKSIFKLKNRNKLNMFLLVQVVAGRRSCILLLYVHTIQFKKHNSSSSLECADSFILAKNAHNVHFLLK